MLLKSTYRKQLLSLCLSVLSFVFCTAQNPIYLENQNPGVPFATWGIPSADSFRAHNIGGFATSMSLNAGQTVHFKVDVLGGANFTMKIYRIGYYGGNGARLMADLGTIAGVAQPPGINDPVTGLFDCDNWSESAQWAIPGSAVSGLYIAKIDRVGGGTNHIVFVVRNDASTSDLYLEFPDATWQAYNGYGGSSTYDGTTGMPSGHAAKVSYNRPFYIYNSFFNTAGRGADWYMNNEYSMIRWLERNGYNVTYTTSEDVSSNPGHLLTHKAFLSVGHDEYWSKEQRNNVEAALNAGVHLAFFSGNEVYWKTRWEADANGHPNRVMVCYKEGTLGNGLGGERTCGGKCDVLSPEWTGLWRTGAVYDAGLPENKLTGQMSWDEAVGNLQVPAAYKKLRFWKNTSVATLGTGQILTVAPNVLAYEWDWEQYPDTYPAGRITMSSTTLNNHTHKLSLYRHSSGALVFGAGTVQWSWGLDGNHFGGSSSVSPDIQQATVNLFADMGVQPFSLQAGLVPGTLSTDVSAPSSAITSPATGTSVSARSTVVISGTASDAGGGVVGGVEISTDGGLTWRATTISSADINITWSFAFIPTVQGTVSVKVRAADDSGNKETPGGGITLNVGPPVCPCTVMIPATDAPISENVEGEALVLGMKFHPNVNGTITGVRFYKTENNTGTHVGKLWTTAGVELGTVTFTGETATGWQQANFASPIAVTAGTTYVVSYHNPTGFYGLTGPFFTQDYPAGPTTDWPIQGIATGAFPNENGVFAHGDATTFPNISAGNAPNYYVDVVFNGSVLGTGTLNGSVTLEGRPAPPNVQWQLPIQVDFYINGNPIPVATYNTTTNSSGQFTIAGVPVGTFNIIVKNSHTLKSKSVHTITTGINTFSLGTLREGDANNDNLVDLLDLIIIPPTYNKAFGNPGYDGRADFNGDNVVDLLDFILFVAHYNQAGDTP